MAEETRTGINLASVLGSGLGSGSPFRLARYFGDGVVTAVRPIYQSIATILVVAASPRLRRRAA
jgi:hypothetical protein